MATGDTDDLPIENWSAYTCLYVFDFIPQKHVYTA